MRRRCCAAIAAFKQIALPQRYAQSPPHSAVVTAERVTISNWPGIEHSQSREVASTIVGSSRDAISE